MVKPLVGINSTFLLSGHKVVVTAISREAVTVRHEDGRVLQLDRDKVAEAVTNPPGE